MNKTTKKSKMSRREEAMELYEQGFSKNEIAEILNLNRSTVTRYFYSPTSAERDDFNSNHAYGAYYTSDGEKILFNRSYQPLKDKGMWVKNIVKQEWYYKDFTPWEQRIKNSNNQTVVYSVNK